MRSAAHVGWWPQNRPAAFCGFSARIAKSSERIGGWAAEGEPYSSRNGSRLGKAQSVGSAYEAGKRRLDLVEFMLIPGGSGSMLSTPLAETPRRSRYTR